MTVVIDVGAARYGGDYSIERLIEQFKPHVLYAFDPNKEALFEAVKAVENREECQIYYDNQAAWTYDGEIGFRADGLNSWLTLDVHAPQVPCFDLAKLIDELWLEHEQKIVLKLDCEGSEYDLLPHLIQKNADSLLDVCIVEWHPQATAAPRHQRKRIEETIKCELREWPW